MKTFQILICAILLAGPALTGCSGAKPTQALSAPGAVLWTFQTGEAVWSPPTVSDEVVYFGSDDKSAYAVDLHTHQLRWKFATGGIVRSRPAVADGVVFVSSDDGVLHALDAAAGTEKWQADLGSARMPVRGELGSGYDYQQSSPVVADEVVYVGSGSGEVDAFKAATGERLWQFMATTRVRSSPAVADGKLYIGDGNGNLYALDAATGVELWKAQGCDNPTPAVANGLVYCGSRGTLQEQAWDAATGEQRWQFAVGHSWIESSARIADGTLFVGSSDAATLFALDPQTGELKWRFGLIGDAWCSPAIANGVVYIGGYSSGADSDFYAVDATTGKLNWKLSIRNGVVSSPTVVDGIVYFGGMDGNLYAVQG